MELKRIIDNIRCSAAAPTPKVLSNEHYVYLIFYVEDSSVQDAENSPFNRVPIDQINTIRFDKYSKYQFGTFEVDNISTHEYYELGLAPYIFQEVIDSDWIEISEEDAHAQYQERHIIIPLKDSCFEIVCRSYSLIQNTCQTMREEVLRIAELV